MKLSSMIFGDVADLFQDSRIEDAVYAAESARLTAQSTSVRHAQILGEAHARIVQLERDNSLLGVVLLSLLRKMGESRPQDVEAIADEVRQVLDPQGLPPAGALKALRDALGLPPAPGVPPATPGKPLAATPLRTPGPLRAPPQGKGPGRTA